MNKLFNKYKDLTFLFTILFLVSITLVVLSFSIAYFSTNKSASGGITLGELDYEIVVNNIEDKILMPGDNIDVDVTIQNSVNGKKNLVPFYFRYKILNKETDCKFIKPAEITDFIYDGDFYYYKYKLEKNKSTNLFKKIIVDENLTQQDANDFDLLIYVDAIQSEYGAYKELFPDAPKEWVEFIENN